MMRYGTRWVKRADAYFMVGKRWVWTTIGKRARWPIVGRFGLTGRAC
jgi:hypothetical protein